MDKIKHKGCADCGSREQEILKSVTVFRNGIESIALCDACIEEAKRGKELI